MLETKTKLPISIIIPTYSEEATLPRLLESIKKQMVIADEVIVADAFSPDHTRSIASSFGCTVVDGGRVARGRNLGAVASKNKYLLFLDADTSLPQPTTLLEAFTEFIKTESDIASIGIKADKVGSNRFSYAVATTMFNAWGLLKKVQTLTQSPMIEGGAFVLVKRSVFDHLGGFNEDLGTSEDRDFFVRAVKRGYKYRNLSQNIFTSTRRYKNPKNTVNSLLSGLGFLILVGVGVSAGSLLMKKVFSKYGRLGGGAGKDPNEE